MMNRVALVIVLATSVSIVLTASAIDIRRFVSWDDETLERIPDLELEIRTQFEQGSSPSEIQILFDEYTSLLHGGEDLVVYLSETNALSENLRGENVLELRNRLDNIYSDWLLRFDALIEADILSSLQRMAVEGSHQYYRWEAVIAIGIIRNPTALPVLKQAAAEDENARVRKYALDAMRMIEEAATQKRSYEQSWR